VSLFEVDTAPGRANAELARRLYEQRKVSNLFTPVGAAEGDLLVRRQQWLRTRVKALHEAARVDYVRSWPAGVPMKAELLTADQVDILARHLDQIEAQHRVTFPGPDPRDEISNEEVPVTTEPTIEPRPDPAAEAVEWADRGKALLSLVDDEPLARACAVAAGCAAKRMTERDYLALQAVVTQLSDPAGAVVAEWHGPDPDIVCHPQAAEMMSQAHGGTKKAGLDAAKTYARAFGLDVPKSLAHAATNPLLAAVVAARADTPNSTKETNSNA
jgi:hypothetical protein